jgi:sulfite reductase beta subunit-like hemoprotein
MDKKNLKVRLPEDEYDKKKVAIKSFYNWQTVDNFREWRKASMNEQLSQLEDISREFEGGGDNGCWVPGGDTLNHNGYMVVI